MYCVSYGNFAALILMGGLLAIAVTIAITRMRNKRDKENR